MFHDALSISELAEATPVCVVLAGRRIGLVRLGDDVHAFDDTCTHAEASLCEGMVSGTEIVCPLHAATFDVRTGQVTGPPADEDIATYPVRVVDGRVQVSLES